MAGGVLAEAEISLEDCGVDRRKLSRAEVFLAEQPVNRTGADRGEEAALGVHPCASNATRSICRQDLKGSNSIRRSFAMALA